MSRSLRYVLALAAVFLVLPAATAVTGEPEVKPHLCAPSVVEVAPLN